MHVYVASGKKCAPNKTLVYAFLSVRSGIFYIYSKYIIYTYTYDLAIF